MATKYKNIVGTAFPNYVKGQIKARENILKKSSRSSKELQWLTNRNGWVRMSSGAVINQSGQNAANSFDAQQQAFQAPQPLTEANANIVDSFIPGISSAVPNPYVTDLAKKHVLQGGIVSTTSEGNIIGRTTFDETYQTGPTDNLGRQPIPGITNISVGTGGKWQTLMQAEVEFTCYNLDQLDIMSKLYMSLGVHVFIEWGHIPYVDNTGEIRLKTEIQPIDFFNEKQAYYKNKKKLLQKISERKRSYEGNYGGLLGRVYNFDWQANPDGSYSCKSYIMGPGGMVESLRINKSSKIDFDLTTTNNNADKYNSDLENALYAIRNFLEQKLKGGPTVQRANQKSFTRLARIDASNFFEGFTISEGAGYGARTATLKRTYEGYGELLNRIYSAGYYKGPTFLPQKNQLQGINFDGNTFGQYGNAHQVISTIGEDQFDGLTPLDKIDDSSPVGSFFNAYNINYRYFGLGLKNDEANTISYITFGHLLMLIQHLGVFVEAEDGSVNLSPSENSPNGPIIYIDCHPENNIVQTGPLEASLDPSKCLIPFKMNTTKENSSEEEAFGVYMAPLEPNKTEPYEWEPDKSSNQSNRQRNLFDPELQNNSINPEIPQNGYYDGRLMNVLISVDFAIETLKNIAESDVNREANLIEYIYALLDGINISLGKVNNFRVFFDDCGHVLRIVDEHLLQKPEDLLEFSNFGLQSVTYDYSYSSKISPKLASQIVIAAQAGNVGINNPLHKFPDDVLSYTKLNGDVRDRFSKVLYPAISSYDREEQQKLEKLKAVQKFFDNLYSVYSVNVDASQSITEGGVVLTLYADLQGVHKKFYQNKRHSLVIPLEFNVTLDGIEGILPYTAFKLPNNRLPLRYRDKIAFCVFSINHDYQQNKWTTTLRGQTIILPESDYIDERKAPETSKNRPPVTGLTTGGDGSLDPDFTPQSQTEYSIQEIVPQEKGIPTAGDVSTQGDGGIAVGLNPLEGNRTISLAQLNPRPDTTIPGLIEFIKPREGLVKTAYPDLTNRTEGQGFIQAANTFQETFTIVGVKNETRTVKAGQWYRWTIGYGSHTITAPNGQFRYVKQGDVITAEDAERDLERNMQEVYIPIARDACEANGVDFDNLPNRVKIVFVDFTYNYDGHLYNNVINSYKNGGKQGLINELKRRMSLPGQVPTRRQAEIDLLQGG